MADYSDYPETGPGGFLVPTLPSPAPSSASTRSVAGLPHPRVHALRPGSAKEDKVRNYVADRISHISRRFIKRSDPDDRSVGYKSMSELCKDLDSLINIIWLSGTRQFPFPMFMPSNLLLTASLASLQVPYLLNLANELNTWLPSFPPAPKATFPILQKLDHCFASLLAGQDYDTKDTLPGFENGLRAGMSRTDMVRCKSLVQQTRVIIMDVMTEVPEDEEEDGTTPQQHEGDSDDGPTDWAKLDLTKEKKPVALEDDEPIFMDLARVYEKTLVQLGETLMEGGGVGDIQISDD
jgi:hypothetical protein